MEQSQQASTVLLGLLVGSRCSTLIYEIMWLQ